MVAIIVSAAVTCACALILGQAILRVCGARRWSWLAAPVGLTAAILVAVPALHLPGRSTTTAVALALLTVGAAVWILRDPAMRPPLGGLVAAAPVAGLTLVPFWAAGRAGTLGVGFNNDMAAHLLYAEVYRSQAVFDSVGLLADYPFGPHALAATLAQLLGIGVESTFAGLSVALTVLLAWTALGTLRDGRLPGQIVVATVAGGSFLVVSYYGQGAFKEVAQAMLVLGVVVALLERDLIAGRLRWVPVAVLCAGALCVYSFYGLAWPVGVLGAAFAVTATVAVIRGSPRATLQRLRAELTPIAIAAGVFVVAIVTQLPRVEEFFSRSSAVNATGIGKEELGNLAGPVPFWEAFGTWDNPDFRLPAIDGAATGAWTAFAAGLVVLGVVLALRRGEPALALGAFVAFAIWFVSDGGQSPYVAAKALMILSPLLLVLAALPLAEAIGGAGDIRRWWRLLAPLLALVLLVKVVDSSVQALRRSPVGPQDHAGELRSLRATIGGRPTIFLGNDDFIRWELAGVPVSAPFIGFQVLALNPAKGSQNGMAFDIDSITPDALNAADWVITTRDPAASAMAPQLRLVRETASYALWRRTGTVRPREVLGEANQPGALLDCKSKAGRAIVRRGGQAALVPESTAVGLPALAPGTSAGVPMQLAPGTYDISTPYTSPRPLSFTIGDLERVMPANLDRAGPRYLIGRITVVPRTSSVTVGVYATRTRLTSPLSLFPATTVVATPVGGRAVVPIRRACGKLVDWYRPGRAPA